MSKICVFAKIPVYEHTVKLCCSKRKRAHNRKENVNIVNSDLKLYKIIQYYTNNIINIINKSVYSNNNKFLKTIFLNITNLFVNRTFNHLIS